MKIYLDNNATTRVDPAVVRAMEVAWTRDFGNSSSSHRFGWSAEAAVEAAREKVASLIGAGTDEVFFTSGATESNNWFLRFFKRGEIRRILTSPLEHKSVLEPAKEVGRELFSVAADGKVRFTGPGAPTPGRHDVVSLMAVNNEIHSLLDLRAAAEHCHRHGATFHCDATQALGRLPLDVGAADVDAVSLSGHKIYGPKGIGALFVKRSLRRFLTPMLRGGEQERGLRAGTVAVPLAVGLGEACELARRALAEEPRRLRGLAELFLGELRERGVTVSLVGPPELAERQPGSLCLEVEGLEGDHLCERMPEVALSQSSACNSRGAGSHVLEALGLTVERARSVIRISFGRFNTEEHARYTAGRLADVVYGRIAA